MVVRYLRVGELVCQYVGTRLMGIGIVTFIDNEWCQVFWSITPLALQSAVRHTYKNIYNCDTDYSHLGYLSDVNANTRCQR